MGHTFKIGARALAVAIAAAAATGSCALFSGLRTEPSTSGIRAAEEVGASEVPLAALHLQLAKEELEQARDLAMKGHKDRATSLLLRSEVDAELAVALSREDTEKSEARAAIERVRQLRQDNQ